MRQYEKVKTRHIVYEIYMYRGQVRQSAWNIGLQWTIFTLGLIGNIALIVIFSKKDLKLRFNRLIILLAVFDLVYVTTQLTLSMINYLDIKDTAYIDIRSILGAMNEVAFSCSAWTAVAISFERYALICHNM